MPENARLDITKIGQNLFIRDLIRQVHRELAEAQDEREKAGDEPLFAVEYLSIEANFVVTRERGGGGGLHFTIITADGKMSYSDQQTHKITLSLSALKPETGKPQIYPGPRRGANKERKGVYPPPPPKR